MDNNNNNKPIQINNSRIMTELKGSLYKEYNQERIGVHVSDLIYCPRESIFRKLHPIPITDRELNFFTSGRAIHDAIQTLAKHYPKYEIEKEIEFIPIENEFTKGLPEIKRMNGIGRKLKILAHIDLFDTEKKIPIEAKSSRKAKLATYNRNTKTWSPEEPKSFNVTQLKIYMALTNSDVGYLMYQLLMNFDKNPFTIFEVRMTEKERIDMLKWLTVEAINYVYSKNSKDPSLVRHVAFDNELNWKCNDCKFLDECLEMRNKEYTANRNKNNNNSLIGNMDDISI